VSRENLAKLNLIRIQGETKPSLSSIAERIRKRAAEEAVTEEEIITEVEKVRAALYKEAESWGGFSG
jgi:hypothetical protein